MTASIAEPRPQLSHRPVLRRLVDIVPSPAPVTFEPPQPKNALEELRQMFAGMRQRLMEDPSFFVVITELALRAKRDPVIEKIGEQRDDFWSRRVTGILKRGVAQGIFRANLDVKVTAMALMTQIKGMSHHAAMRERDPSEIDAIVVTVAAQVEHWLTCRESQSPARKKLARRGPENKRR